MEMRMRENPKQDRVCYRSECYSGLEVNTLMVNFISPRNELKPDHKRLYHIYNCMICRYKGRIFSSELYYFIIIKP